MTGLDVLSDDTNRLRHLSGRSSKIVANLIDFNINQLAICLMIACMHIMDVIIFQNVVAGIYICSKTFVYVMPTFSDIG